MSSSNFLSARTFILSFLYFSCLFSLLTSDLVDIKDPIEEIKKVKDKIEIKFMSQSFLQKQVRSMVGCLKYLAEKKWDLKKIEKVFKSKKRNLCAPPAPSHGLFLEKIIY